MLVKACWATFELIERLRRETHETAPELPGLEAVPERVLSAVCDAFLEKRDRDESFRKAGGRAWVVQVLRQLKRELGGAPLSAFVPPKGNEFVSAYRDRCRQPREKGGYALTPKTTKDRLSVLRQVLHYAAEQGEIPVPPHFPRAVSGKMGARRPVYLWIDALTFRRLREAVYSQPAERAALASALARKKQPYDAAAVDDYVARRRLYLSFAFYTGAHTADLDALDDSWVSHARGLYLRHNEKSAHAVADAMIEAPQPLMDDINAELARLGRPWFRGEKICGDRWLTVARVCRETAQDLGLGVAVNPRVFRRSFVRELALRGYTEDEVIKLMGHADSTMVRQVYQDPALMRPQVRTRWVSDEAPAPPESAQVFQLHTGRAR